MRALPDGVPADRGRRAPAWHGRRRQPPIADRCLIGRLRPAWRRPRPWARACARCRARRGSATSAGPFRCLSESFEHPSKRLEVLRAVGRPLSLVTAARVRRQGPSRRGDRGGNRAAGTKLAGRSRREWAARCGAAGSGGGGGGPAGIGPAKRRAAGTGRRGSSPGADLRRGEAAMGLVAGGADLRRGVGREAGCRERRVARDGTARRGNRDRTGTNCSRSAW